MPSSSAPKAPPFELTGALLHAFDTNEKVKPDIASFPGYLFAHDAHHRGQVMMHLRRIPILGILLPPPKAVSRLR